MAKDPREKENKKLAKASKKVRRKQTRSQMWQAFQMQRKKDKKLIPFMLLGFLVPIVVMLALSLLFGWWWLNLIVGIMFGVLAAFWIFSRRLQAGVYDQIEGEAGAAGWALQNLRDGVGVKWITETAVASNTHMDAVHRVVGVPGVILVGEGSRHRLKPMMAQERKRLARILGNTPIYDVYIGKGEDEVEIRKLQNHLVRMPRNLKKKERPRPEQPRGVHREAALARVDDAEGAGAAQRRQPGRHQPSGTPRREPQQAGLVRDSGAHRAEKTPVPTGRGRRGGFALPRIVPQDLAGDQRVRITAVPVARSCIPRPSVSWISGGSRKTVSTVRTMERTRPTRASASSTRATPMPSSAWPGDCPKSHTVTMRHRAHTRSTTNDTPPSASVACVMKKAMT